MWTPRDRSDLQSAIDFFGTPLVVDVLYAIRDGHSPGHHPDLSQYGDAVDAAVALLTNQGAVAVPQPDAQSTTEQPLTLTMKGKAVCALVEELVDFDTFPPRCS